ncbi:MAG TPA: hypothetical protein VI564_08015 [Candidatus Nanoarchaeia archaeon]|nr:hypothetical protein [Candidatus Nanoarchaeia archaeon]
MQPLLHVKVGEKLRKRMEVLVDSGLFNNNVEIIREGLRDILSKYPDISKNTKKSRS